MSTKTRVEAVLAYYSGLSFRSVARLFGEAFSAESVRYWWNRIATIMDYPRGSHGIVVADETMIFLGCKHGPKYPYVLWVAIDARDMTVVTTKFARFRSNFDCRDFLAEVKHRSQPKNPLVLHDRGPWYVTQPRLAGVRHEQVRGGKRNLVECWNQQLKRRLDRFWRVFPKNSSLLQVGRWLKAYSAIWTVLRA